MIRYSYTLRKSAQGTDRPIHIASSRISTRFRQGRISTSLENTTAKYLIVDRKRVVSLTQVETFYGLRKQLVRSKEPSFTLTHEQQLKVPTISQLRCIDNLCIALLFMYYLIPSETKRKYPGLEYGSNRQSFIPQSNSLLPGMKHISILVNLIWISI